MKNKIILDFKDLIKMYHNSNLARNLNGAKNILPILQHSILAEECAYLIGKTMGDGNLDNKYIIRLIGQKEEIIYLKSHISRIFKINQKKIKFSRRQCKGISYMLQINCAYLGRIMSLLGAPVGNKTKSSFRIPKWILENKSNSLFFLKVLLKLP